MSSPSQTATISQPCAYADVISGKRSDSRYTAASRVNTSESDKRSSCSRKSCSVQTRFARRQHSANESSTLSIVYVAGGGERRRLCRSDGEARQDQNKKQGPEHVEPLVNNRFFGLWSMFIFPSCPAWIMGRICLLDISCHAPSYGSAPASRAPAQAHAHASSYRPQICCPRPRSDRCEWCQGSCSGRCRVASPE